MTPDEAVEHFWGMYEDIRHRFYTTEDESHDLTKRTTEALAALGKKPPE